MCKVRSSRDDDNNNNDDNLDEIDPRNISLRMVPRVDDPMHATVMAPVVAGATTSPLSASTSGGALALPPPISPDSVSANGTSIVPPMSEVLKSAQSSTRSASPIVSDQYLQFSMRTLEQYAQLNPPSVAGGGGGGSSYHNSEYSNANDAAAFQPYKSVGGSQAGGSDYSDVSPVAAAAAAASFQPYKAPATMDNQSAYSESSQSSHYVNLPRPPQ